MSASKKITMYLYTRYERFWHWLQMALIFVLLVTGFEVHGSFPFLGFNQAVDVHNTVGLAWLIAFAFFIFWVFTTGEWKQYIPTTKKMFQVVLYYSYGIFQGRKPSGAQAQGCQAQPPPADRLPVSWPPFCSRCRCSRVFSTGDTTRGTPGGWAGSRWTGHRPGPYGRCIRDPVFHHRPRLHDHHRTHRHRPRQGHDHRLGGC
jgi:hypothetical protein